MWDDIKTFLFSQSLWSAVFFMLAGAALSIYFTFKAQRPKLFANGVSGGGGANSQRWSIAIENRPSFLGLPFAGETARDVHASLSLRERGSRAYPLRWLGPVPGPNSTLEPGKSGVIELFSWSQGQKCYCVLDQAGNPVAQFELRELEFYLRLFDYLGRETKIRIAVMFDNTHLQNPPSLRIMFPVTLRTRINLLRNGFATIRRAFRSFYG